MILVQSSPTSLLRDHGHHPNLGVLSGPRRTYKNVEGWPWAADNDAFLAWDEDRFVKMLDKITGIPGCLFATAPDVVGDADATLERFHEWAYRIRETGQPVAFVAQDGIENHPVPWGIVDALFIGGSTEFKLGPVAARHVREAKQRGLWVHVGRVNTLRRMKYMASIGVDSIDGTKFSMFRHTYLDAALAFCAAPKQLGLAI